MSGAVAEFSCSERFLRDLLEWEERASPKEMEALEIVLAGIAVNPRLPGRFSSYYDPDRPSFLYRFGPLIIHYRVMPDGTIEFLNLFRR
jgi:hypothetical protein